MRCFNITVCYCVNKVKVNSSALESTLDLNYKIYNTLRKAPNIAKHGFN